MTRNETHVHDISTLVNFKDWAMSIGAALTAFGWVQTADTGQVSWGAIASVPTSGNYVYEVWKPGDALTAFYVRIDYGNNGGNPGFKVQGGTGTNGAGTLNGITSTLSTLAPIANNGATLYNCLYSGDSSSFAVMMWRDQTSCNFAFGFDRSRNGSGAATATYFTQFMTRDSSDSNNSYTQQSVLFGVSAAPRFTPHSGSTGNFVTIISTGSGGGIPTSLLYNGNIAACPVFPFLGYFDNPVLVFAQVAAADFVELATFSTTIYGVTHSFVMSKSGCFNNANNSTALAMRWE